MSTNHWKAWNELSQNTWTQIDFQTDVYLIPVVINTKGPQAKPVSDCLFYH